MLETGLGRVDLFYYCDLKRLFHTMESWVPIIPCYGVGTFHMCDFVMVVFCPNMPSYFTGMLSVQQTNRDGIQ